MSTYTSPPNVQGIPPPGQPDPMSAPQPPAYPQANYAAPRTSNEGPGFLAPRYMPAGFDELNQRGGSFVQRDVTADDAALAQVIQRVGDAVGLDQVHRRLEVAAAHHVVQGGQVLLGT